MRRESPICDWRARTRYRPNEPARWLFFDIGIYAFLHVPLLFLVASVICISAKTGARAPCAGPIPFLPLPVPGVIFYIFYIEMTSSCDV